VRALLLKLYPIYFDLFLDGVIFEKLTVRENASTRNANAISATTCTTT